MYQAIVFLPLAAAPNVLWNFYEATSLVFDRQFIGSVLAPYANVTVSNSLEGTLVSSNATINGRIGLQPYAGSLPGGTSVCAVVTNDAVKELALQVGQSAVAVIKASHVILAVQG